MAKKPARRSDRTKPIVRSKARKPNKPNKPNTVTTQSALADRLGWSRAKLVREMRKPGWPVAKKAPWLGGDITKIKRWYGATDTTTKPTKPPVKAQKPRSKTPKAAVLAKDSRSDVHTPQDDLDNHDTDDLSIIHGDDDAQGGTAGGDMGVDARLKEQRIKFTRERTENERLKRELLQQQHVRRDQVDGSIGGIIAVFVETYNEIELSWPSRFPGIDTKEMIRLLDSYRQRIVDKGRYELESFQSVSNRTKRTGRPTVS